MATAPRYRVFAPVIVGIVGVAWLSLVLWGQSPYARYLHHDELAEIDRGHRSGLLLVFVAGWILMTIAMMLPTSLPLFTLFHGLTRRRPDQPLLIALLLVAGAYQFTPLKYHCLERCRSPLSFIMGHWQGRRERWQALWLGMHHGLFCLGCCWSLMLLMFVVGVGNLAWMLVLAAVMAAEKNLPWGRRLSAPLGLALLYWGAVLAALHLVGFKTPFWLSALGGPGA